MATSKFHISRELITRSFSAIILGCITIFCCYYSWESFIALIIAVTLIMVWEWGKLTNNDTPLQLSIHLFTITLIIISFIFKEWPLFMASLIGGSFLIAWATHYWWRSKWALFGLLYIAMPVVSFIYLRQDPDYGFLAILFIFLIVWATDTAAYFSGRHFGGKKLVPTISPGKTLAGSIGGSFAGLITGVLFAISIEAEPILLGLIGLILSVVSQLGDIGESAIKRHFGVKDSSNIIPGHGGVFDRLDGVIVAAIMAAFIAYLHQGITPAQSLLIWTP